MGQLAVAYTHAPRRPIDRRVRDSHQWLSKDISIASLTRSFFARRVGPAAADELSPHLAAET
jgi:hypothetical protein